MATTYKLVGYDRASELLVEKLEIPAGLVARATEAAGIAAGEELMGDWPLTDGQAQTIAALIGQPLDLLHREYMLEPYAEALSAA